MGRKLNQKYKIFKLLIKKLLIKKFQIKYQVSKIFERFKTRCSIFNWLE